MIDNNIYEYYYTEDMDARLIDHAKENPKITDRQAAEYLNMECSRFYNEFKKHHGKSFRQYKEEDLGVGYAYKHMEVKAEIANAPELSIKKIGRKFSSSEGTINKEFSKKEGVSPVEYREGIIDLRQFLLDIDDKNNKADIELTKAFSALEIPAPNNDNAKALLTFVRNNAKTIANISQDEMAANIEVSSEDLSDILKSEIGLDYDGLVQVCSSVEQIRKNIADFDGNITNIQLEEKVGGIVGAKILSRAFELIDGKTPKIIEEVISPELAAVIDEYMAIYNQAREEGGEGFSHATSLRVMYSYFHDNESDILEKTGLNAPEFYEKFEALVDTNAAYIRDFSGFGDLANKIANVLGQS